MISGIENAIFNRTSLLVGRDVLEVLSEIRVILFGVGGVGSWCAEGLVRSGVKHLTLVDSDRVCVTNVNRQLMATTHTVGQVKVEALKERLLEINPNAEIRAIQHIFSAETADQFDLSGYDYILDAIDSLKDKAELILRATHTPAVFFCSMGAACKVDPTQVRVAEFWNVRGCPLGAAIRKKFKQNHTWPGHKFRCVYDEEVLPNRGKNAACGTEQCMCPKAQDGPGDHSLLNNEWCSHKAQINGSLAHVTAIFGMTLAGLVIKDVYDKVTA